MLSAGCRDQVVFLKLSGTSLKYCVAAIRNFGRSADMHEDFNAKVERGWTNRKGQNTVAAVMPPRINKNRPLSFAAFPIFVLGFVLPLLCWAFWLPKILLWVACGAEMLAFVLGVKAWRHRPARMAVIGAAAFGLLGLWLGGKGLPTYPLKIKPTADWMKPLDANWITQSAAKPWSIQTDAGMKRNGDDSLRFELRASDTWTDQTFQHTFRAEVTSKEFPPANSTKWYAFSVYFPTNFPIEDNRLVFAQWKDRESLLTGLRRQGHSPPLAFRFVNGKFSIRLYHSADRVIRDRKTFPRKHCSRRAAFPWANGRSSWCRRNGPGRRTASSTSGGTTGRSSHTAARSGTIGISVRNSNSAFTVTRRTRPTWPGSIRSNPVTRRRQWALTLQPRCVIRLSELTGVAEATVILESTPKAVESRLYRARQTLREWLKQWL